MNEEWRAIPGHPGYEASSLGRVRSWRKHGPGGPPPRYPRGGTTRGYRTITLYHPDGRRANGFIHRLVAAAFLGPYPHPKAEVRHLDGVKTNNRVSNLAYGTHAENGDDLHRHGTHPGARMTHCKHGHPFDEANTYRRRRAGGGRSCRKCKAEWQARAVAEGRVKKYPSRYVPKPRKPRPPRTHCRHGHELAGANLYVRPNGTRECRVCSRAAVRRWHHKRVHAGTANSSITVMP